MSHHPGEFNPRIHVAAYQARRIEENALRNMPLVDRVGSKLIRRDMDVLLAVLWALIISVAICLAYVTLSPAGISPEQPASRHPINTPDSEAGSAAGRDSAR